MKHTNAQRAQTGQFASSDAPKAKRIEVWLQPQTVALLDIWCRQWDVGRGKAIDRLLSLAQFPVPAPEVDTKPTPAPSAPPAGLKRVADLEDEPEPPAPSPPAPEPEPQPEPEPTHSGRGKGQQARIANFPGVQNRKVWIVVRVNYGKDGGLSQCCHYNGIAFGKPDAPKPETARALTAGGGLFSIGNDETLAGLVLGTRVEFALNVTDGSIWANGVEVPSDAAATAWRLYQEAHQLTPSGREVEDFQQAMSRFAEQGRERWEKITAEAKRIGITAKQLERLLPQLKLSVSNLPLSPEAVQAIHQMLERGQRTAGARERVYAERLALINQATPNLFADLADHCGSVELSDGKVAIDYLLRRLPDLGLKPYRKLCAGLWQQLEQVVQWADLKSEHLSSVPARRALFWGVVLRLDHLGTDVPTDSARFLEWCRFTVHQEHASRARQQSSDDLDRRLFDFGAMSDAQAREVLGLPAQGTELTRTAINDAYKAHARQHHPDAGGDAARFQRITKARDRLLLAVGG